MSDRQPLDHRRLPAPSRVYPSRGMRPPRAGPQPLPPPLLVDGPWDQDYVQFLSDVAGELSKLEVTHYRLRSCQPTLCNYWHETERFGVCWKCSNVTRAYVTPSITPPNWAGVEPGPPADSATLEVRRAYWLARGDQ